MTIQLLVTPDRIEPELKKLWESAAQEKKTRASLFNLIVFNRLSDRTDYIRKIAQRVAAEFPCRTLFITEDPSSEQSYLKTAISLVIPASQESACDQIDIGVAGEKIKEVPFLILPHLLPDLPIYLLWTEDPSQDHSLFLSLSSFASRVIFDSESADHLLEFAKTVLDLYEKKTFEIADLNWARTEGWRELFISTFDTPQRIEELLATKKITLSYNARKTPFFCHLKIQSIYLLSWLSTRLGWKGTLVDNAFLFENGIKATLEPFEWEKLGPGTIIGLSLSSGNHSFEAKRKKEHYHIVEIHISSEEECKLPYSFILGKAATGQSLVKEIITKETSLHYMEMLKNLFIPNVIQESGFRVT